MEDTKVFTEKATVITDKWLATTLFLEDFKATICYEHPQISGGAFYAAFTSSASLDRTIKDHKENKAFVNIRKFQEEWDELEMGLASIAMAFDAESRYENQKYNPNRPFVTQE